MYRLLVNGDDFGLTRGVNHGIVDCFLHGVLRSTTLMGNGEAFDHALALAFDHPELRVGIHLNATGGRPLTGCAGLTGEDGRFCGKSALWGALNGEGAEEILDQIRDEWWAQADRCLSGGLVVSHLDSHHYVHGHPKLRPLIGELARALDLPVRIPLWENRFCPEGLGEGVALLSDAFYRGFYKAGLSARWWEDLEIFCRENQVPEGALVEMMCHPGYLDLDLAECSSYSIHRMRELRILCSGDRGWQGKFLLAQEPAR